MCVSLFISFFMQGGGKVYVLPGFQAEFVSASMVPVFRISRRASSRMVEPFIMPPSLLMSEAERRIVSPAITVPQERMSLVARISIFLRK